MGGKICDFFVSEINADFSRKSQIFHPRVFCDQAEGVPFGIGYRPSGEGGMGAGTGGAGWASAHPGKNQGGHGPPWKF